MYERMSASSYERTSPPPEIAEPAAGTAMITAVPEAGAPDATGPTGLAGVPGTAAETTAPRANPPTAGVEPAGNGQGAGVLDGCAVRVVDPQKVATVASAMPDGEAITELAQVFGLLSDPGRLRVIIALLEGGEMCVCDIAAACGNSESAVSHALRLLRAHRVVRVRRAGRMAYYRLDDSHVRMLLDLALAHVGHRTEDSS
jgi:DNA-binding transcriptional ArsR family regulator